MAKQHKTQACTSADSTIQMTHDADVNHHGFQPYRVLCCVITYVADSIYDLLLNGYLGLGDGVHLRSGPCNEHELVA